MSRSELHHIENVKKLAWPALQAAGLANDHSEVEIEPKLGRNISGIFSIDASKYFVKAIVGLHAEARYKRANSFFGSDLQFQDTELHTPQLIFTEPGTYLEIFEYLDDGVSLTDVAQENSAPLDLLQRVGSAVAGLHSSEAKNPSELHRDLPGLPPVANSAIPLELVEGSTIGQLDLWRIIQSDSELGSSLSELVLGDYTPTPIHGDLRTDQIFYSPSSISLIDWEDFRLGDPARDLGALMGEILYHQLRHLTRLAANETGEVTDEAVHETGGALIAAAQPSLAALWNGYLSSGSHPDTGTDAFKGRIIGYIGWQMFDRAMAIGTYMGRITAFERALIGIGRQLVLENIAYSKVLGI